MEESKVIIVPTEMNDFHTQVVHPRIETLTTIIKEPSTTFGLKCKYFCSVGNNDEDYPWYPFNGSDGIGKFGEKQCFSYDNQKALKFHFDKMLAKKDRLVIVEIGILADEYSRTSTSVFLSSKRDQDIYVGIDIRDLTAHANPEKNIHILQERSENHQSVYNFLNNLGIDKIDVFMIDGHHSINQVYQEWEYVSRLSDDGVVVLHDTNSHSGPYFAVESIDDTLFDIYKYCNDIRDWGLAIAVRK
jgi:hypothetical protein